MNTEHRILERISTAVRNSPSLIALGVEPQFIRSKAEICFPFRIASGGAVAYLRLENGRFHIYMAGRNKQTRQALRRVLLGAARLISRPAEHHELAVLELTTPPKSITRLLSAWLQSVQTEAAVRDSLFQGKQSPSANDVFGFWADVRSNFGDQIGPWLVQQMSGRRLVNSRYSSVDHGRMLATVGSVIHMLPTSATKSADIWGSGLMRKPTPEELVGLRKLCDVKVHAVRGKRTRDILRGELGWDVPEIYGDPALLCPRFYEAKTVEAAKGKVAVVPHFKHMEHHFTSPADFQSSVGESSYVVDVHADLRDVIDQISSASVCVSSSLHGIIIAQAYGVPWVWLYTPDSNIGGDRFKFDDFFSCLKDPETVASHSVPIQAFPSLDFEELASSASLPALGVNLDDLQNAFPLANAVPRISPIHARFRWSEFSAEDRFMADVRAAYRISH